MSRLRGPRSRALRYASEELGRQVDVLDAHETVDGETLVLVRDYHDGETFGIIVVSGMVVEDSIPEADARRALKLARSAR